MISATGYMAGYVKIAESKRSLALAAAGVSGLPIFRDFQFNT